MQGRYLRAFGRREVGIEYPRTALQFRRAHVTQEDQDFDRLRYDEAQSAVDRFKEFLEAHKDTLVALQIFYGRPYAQRRLTYEGLEELRDAMRRPPWLLEPINIWRAYKRRRGNGSRSCKICSRPATQLGLGQPLTVVREQTREQVQRKRALGDWGEKKALDLLKRAGFRNVRDINAESANHPFGDIYAERDAARYLIGVKTRNKYQVSGLINPTYNVRKRGADVKAIAQKYNATLAWIAIAVVPEKQHFSAYFGTIAQIEDAGERFSIPMRPEQTKRYKCLSRPLEEFDELIR
jgi:hypothetical protein